MTLAIEISPAEETALARIAEEKGMAPEEYARRVLSGELRRAEQRVKNQATIDLLDSWIKEAETFTEEEKRAADEEWRESMRDLDAHRESYRKLFPELADGEEAMREAA